MKYEIISKDIAFSGSILGDITKLDGVFDYTIKCNLTETVFEVRSKPEDLYHKFIKQLSQYLVDAEIITGNIGVDYICCNVEGDIFNIQNVDVCEWHDIIYLVPLKDKIKVCEEFIAYHTQPKNHYSDGTCYYNGVIPCSGCGECND